MPAETVLPTTTSHAYEGLEYSVHKPPSSLLREIITVFPDASITTTTPLLVIPTFQRAVVPLMEFGDPQAAEKDRLLERFFEWCDKVTVALRQLEPDAWVDATDPASGMARLGASGSCYSDVDGIVRLLHLDTVDLGGCRVAVHPKWRFAVYPATLFTSASKTAVLQALACVNEC